MFGLVQLPWDRRVARGAALLDQKFPGWEDRIDVDRLDVATIDWCVLGQVYGGYGRGMQLLGFSHRDHGTHYGFFGLWPTTRAWTRLIRARLAARQQTPITPAGRTAISQTTVGQAA